MDPELDAFLKSCKESGNQAYSNFKDLLEKLRDESTRAEARRFLAKLEDVTGGYKGKDQEEACMKEFNFQVHQLALSDIQGAREGEGGSGGASGSGRQTLTLLEMSSIFIPEEWSFTFYEGLARHPDTGFRARSVCELGCGNGWISIALAERTSPDKVYGLDINPRAIKIAWINLYLNALTRDGTPVVDSEGKTLLDRVEFYESDLLGWIRERGILLDKVVGCIPQVLTPDPRATLKIVSETLDEDFLYALSNYCSLQGYVEDQFGLGLIARAVEESIEVVKPTGAVILNMGGRPGQAVCERLFLRRGFSIQKLWQTRVFQALDTDITPLVEIERNSRHRFEFFMGPGAEEPISARTAYAYAKAGGRIAHGLTVYECRLNQPNYVKDIFRFLDQKGMEDTRSAVDLSFNSEAIADEKLAFLAHLANTLKTNLGTLATCDEPAAGSDLFRTQIAGFLRLYFRIPLCAKNVVVVPSRAAAIESLLRLYSPPLALVDGGLTRSLPKAWLSSLPVVSSPDSVPTEAVTPVVLQAPRRTDLLVKLARALKPRVIVACLADFEARSSTAFQQLVSVSAEIGTRLFLDISEHLELSSMPSSNGVLQYLAENPLPEHVAIICGLVKNQVYSDLEISFVVSESEPLLRALGSAGELSYFRAPLMQQLYYGCLLHELLSFQIPDRHTSTTRPLMNGGGTEGTEGAGSFLQVNKHVQAAFQHPAVGFCQLAPVDVPGGVVRMDSSPSGLPTCTEVQQMVFEGFVRQHLSEAEMDPRSDLLQLLKRRFGISPDGTSVIAGDGSCTLFANLMSACSAEGGSVLFPQGSFGSFVATARFYGVPVVTVETDAADAFKLTPHRLNEALSSVSRPWLVLSAPVVNPTGALYSQEETAALLAECRKHGARVVLDSYFSGLEFSGGADSLDLQEFLTPSDQSGDTASRFAVAVLAELSPMLSLGGILFAFVAVRDAFLREALANVIAPHGTTRYAVKKLAAILCQGETTALSTILEERKQGLIQKAKKLVEVLKECGWEPLVPKGGISLVAKPSAYLGKTVTYESRAEGGGSVTLVLDSDNIGQAMYETVGLLISRSTWTGIPGMCRFVFFVDDKSFEIALDRIREFHKLVG